MSARDHILARIRAAQGRSGAAPASEEMALVHENLARRTVGPLPAFAHAPDRVAQFRKECDRLGTTHTEAQALAEVPAQVARYLAANDLAPRVVLWHDLTALDWAGTGIAIDDRDARPEDRTGVTGCFCAIAETGTVLMLSSHETPKGTALLPETHVCVVSRARLVATMEDAFTLLRAERGEPPRSAWFVSGPSRTADIEQTIVIGAHGPYRVHVVLVP